MSSVPPTDIFKCGHFRIKWYLHIQHTLRVQDIVMMTKFDIAVYGSTSGAVAAAIQATRLGRKTVLISPDEHIGEQSLLHIT